LFVIFVKTLCMPFVAFCMNFVYALLWHFDNGSMCPLWRFDIIPALLFIYFVVSWRCSG
jgi:hypothetical protein